MNRVLIKTKKEILIESVDDWFRYAPPEGGETQWVDGRSAKELAKSWFRTPTIPWELKDLLENHPSTRGLVVDIGFLELETKLDSFPGKGRQSDLILLGRLNQQRMLIAVEAKADEPFGDTIEERKNKTQNPESNISERIDKLCLSIFGRKIDQDAKIKHLRYQLLHGLAGTLIEAKNQGAKLAVFLVHEFRSPSLQFDRLLENSEDFKKFFRMFPDLNQIEIEPGVLYGPVQIPGDPERKFVPNDIPFLAGKIITDLT